jgi:hypothetical protein
MNRLQGILVIQEGLKGAEATDCGLDLRITADLLPAQMLRSELLKMDQGLLQITRVTAVFPLPEQLKKGHGPLRSVALSLRRTKHKKSWTTDAVQPGIEAL